MFESSRKFRCSQCLLDQEGIKSNWIRNLSCHSYHHFVLSTTMPVHFLFFLILLCSVSCEVSSWQTRNVCQHDSLNFYYEGLEMEQELHHQFCSKSWLVLQDWIWSVGCNPFSVTSRGWHISQFQSDTIARSYILTTLEESIQVVNSAINRLVMERTCILSMCVMVTVISEFINQTSNFIFFFPSGSTYLFSIVFVYTLSQYQPQMGQLQSFILLLHQFPSIFALGRQIYFVI